MKSLTIAIPLRLPSLANCRLHWAKLHRLKQAQAKVVYYSLHGKPLPPLPAVVTLTRVGKQRLDDDNLASSFKAVQDAVAAMYQTDDGSPLYQWRYEQRIGREYAVEISIQSL